MDYSAVIPGHPKETCIYGGYTSAFSTGNYKKDWLVIKTDSIGNTRWIPILAIHYVNEVGCQSASKQKIPVFCCREARGSVIVRCTNPFSKGLCARLTRRGTCCGSGFNRRYDYHSTSDEIRYSSMNISDVIELEDGSLEQP
jgi:hypothetical protein